MIFQKLDVKNGTHNGFVSFESKIIIVVLFDLVLYNLSSDPLTLSADAFVSKGRCRWYPPSARVKECGQT